MGQRQGLTLARWQPVLLRFLKFALVGTVGVLINSVVLIALHARLGLDLVPASAIAVEIAILQNFFWNNRWTFRERGVSLVRLTKYNLISLGGLVITTGTLYLLVSRLNLHYLTANLIGIGLATAWNFGLNSAWTWGWKS